MFEGLGFRLKVSISEVRRSDKKESEGFCGRGQNHCRLHCRLAKFRGLMIVVKYGAVIGFKKPIAWKL